MNLLTQPMDLKTYISEERGRATKLAADLEISTSYLSQMASGLAPVSEKRASQIETLTGGAVSRKVFFPGDWQIIWPELVEQQ